jgi:hypothetical protein
MGLASNIVETINQRVIREYPEMRGCRPSITSEKERYTLLYRSRVSTPAGDLARVVRVVADERGHILRMSTSK